MSDNNRTGDEAKGSRRKRKRGAANVDQNVALLPSTAPTQGAFDLFVMVPRKQASSTTAMIPANVMIQKMLKRLAGIGYQGAALTHTCYGRPLPDVDRVDIAIPASLYENTVNQITEKLQPNFRLWKRLNIVVESLSDVGLYASTRNSDSTPNEVSLKHILHEYDLISLTPRNEATFQAACSSAATIDIISLDYTIGRSGLPFKLKKSDIGAATEKNISFEIPYASAILNRQHRKILVQLSRELQMINTYPNPRILFSSSGSRSLAEDQDADLGSMALRSPGDLANLLQSVMGFTSNAASLGVTPGKYIWSDADKRKRSLFVTTNSKEGVVEVYMEKERNNNSEKESNRDDDNKSIADNCDLNIPGNEQEPKEENISEKNDPIEDDKVSAEDGFISL